MVLTIKMLLKSSIMHEFIDKDTFSFFLAKPKKLYQVSVMYPRKKSHLSIEACVSQQTPGSDTNYRENHLIPQQLLILFGKKKRNLFLIDKIKQA